MADDRRPVVALVSDAILPYHRGGKEVRYREIARRLTAWADVHLYTMNWWRGERTRTEDGVVLYAISPFLPLYSARRRSIRQAVVFAFGCLRLIFRRFDVIEADHMPYMQLFPLRLVCALKRKRLVATWHEFWGPDYWRAYLGPFGRVGWWFERLAMRLPDHIIAASPTTADRLRPYVSEKTAISVATNGVDLDLIQAVPTWSEPCDVVVVGRMLRHKRLDLLIDAISVLRDQGMPVSCRIIGDGPEREPLRTQANDRGVAHLIDFRHDVTELETLYSHLKSARVFAFPSEREGFGIAVLEALACGLPVITTSAPDNLANDLLQRAPETVVCEATSGSFAEGIRLALERNSSPEVHTWLSEFDWSQIAGHVARVLLDADTGSAVRPHEGVMQHA